MITIKLKVEEDENGEIGYRVMTIDGFKIKQETDKEANEMMWESEPRIYMKNEHGNNILEIKSLMYVVQMFEEGEIAENIHNQNDIDYWNDILEKRKRISWENTVIAHSKEKPIVGSETEIRINHSA